MIDYRLIIDQVKSGNRRARQQLYSLTIRYLTAVCQRYIVGEDDVKDVLQESYVKIFMNIGTFQQREEATVLSWMTRIVVNESLMFIRQKEHYAFIDINDELPDCEEELEVEEFSADDIQKAIMQLPTGYRTVFNLYVFEDKSHREIAQILGIGESSSASQLNRAKKMIRSILYNNKISYADGREMERKLAE